MKRIINILLALTVLCLSAASLVHPVYADSESIFIDIEDHWAKDNIIWNVLNGFFSGKSDTIFDPDGVMTRGMFVTVMTRISGEDPDSYRDWYLDVMFTDVRGSQYYAPNINWAVRNGVAAGVGGGKFSPDTSVTREQMAALIVKLLNIYNFTIDPDNTSAAVQFSDKAEISDYAQAPVEQMKAYGLINGKPDGNGGLRFDPKAGLTRAECATVLRQLVSKMKKQQKTAITADGVFMSGNILKLEKGDNVTYSAIATPDNITNKTILWISSDPKVARVDSNGNVTALSIGTSKLYAYTSNGKFASIELTVEDNSVAFSTETYEQKCMRVFGTYVKDPRGYYKSNESALADMTKITVRVWDFVDKAQTAKTTKTFTLTVHKNLASTYIAIFEEIYNGPEQFPIKSLGCYRWSSHSEHNAGMAVDINPNANYLIDHGDIQSGDHWLPGVDPYSIPLTGDVVTAFARYGFKRGFWGERKDYMHFSYFGT